MDMELMKNVIICHEFTPEDYVSLRSRSGMGDKDLQRSKAALRNSLFLVGVRLNGELIGAGRVVGDGGVTYCVTDIMVDRRYHGRGIGSLIMEKIDGYLKENTHEDSYVILIANRPADRLYERFSFICAEEGRVGMIRNQKP